MAVVIWGALAVSVEVSADLRTGMYPVAAEKVTVFSGEVRNFRNIAAASWFSLGMAFGMPIPAPPVGHTGEAAAGPPGRNPAPTLVAAGDLWLALFAVEGGPHADQRKGKEDGGQRYRCHAAHTPRQGVHETPTTSAGAWEANPSARAKHRR